MDTLLEKMDKKIEVDIFNVEKCRSKFNMNNLVTPISG